MLRVKLNQTHGISVLNIYCVQNTLNGNLVIDIKQNTDSSELNAIITEEVRQSIAHLHPDKSPRT